MRDIDLGCLLLVTSIGLAVGFDSVSVASIGCFMAGMGLGYLSRANK